MEVTIWIKLITMPARKPITSSGAPSQSVIMSAWRRISTTNSGVIFFSRIKTFHQRSQHQVPTVHKNEEQDFERRRDHHRRQLDHADRERDRRHHQVDDDERQK